MGIPGFMGNTGCFGSCGIAATGGCWTTGAEETDPGVLVICAGSAGAPGGAVVVG